MPPAIRVENLSKRYRIGQASRGAPYRTLRESLVEAARSGWRRQRNDANQTFWALKNIDFEVQPGEVVGIIGRNGAGKSTLLKILSQITEPTNGRVELRGRLGSLLEVGTGFHPELTGRENIYLNGSILGMSRREITGRFDEIVSFAEMEQFLDTPVKRYSSGMYVRLAFSVAAHLDPEILVLDEVLAVGDATYQKRCIDRMSALANEGRTVLFVSHNMDLIPRLCQRALVLSRGEVIEDGEACAVVENYLSSSNDDSQKKDLSDRQRSGDGRARFSALELLASDGTKRVEHPSGDDLVLRITIISNSEIKNAAIAANLRTIGGARLISGWTRESAFPVDLRMGEQHFECRFRRVRLRPGYRISIELWMEAGNVLDHIEDARIIEILDVEETRNFSTDRHQGAILCDYEWARVG